MFILATLIEVNELESAGCIVCDVAEENTYYCMRINGLWECKEQGSGLYRCKKDATSTSDCGAVIG